MRGLVRGVVLASVALGGCQDGFDISGHTLEGYDTFGNRGGTMHSPDGNFTLEVDRGAIRHEIDLTIGVLDDCIPGEIACYELEPSGLILRREATATLDISRLVDTDFSEDPAPLVVLAHGSRGWHVVESTDTHADTVSVGLTTLGPVSVVSGEDDRIP